MLEHFRMAWRTAMTPPARLFLALGLTPVTVTIVGAAIAVAVALVFFPLGWLWQGAVVLGVVVCADGVDGEMARRTSTVSRFGAVLDASLDRVVDGAVFVGLIVHLAATAAPPWWVGVAAWALLAAQATSYVKARAEAEGFTATVGIAARADRLIVALAGALIAGLWTPWALLVAMGWLAVASTITVVQRLVTVARQSRVAAPR